MSGAVVNPLELSDEDFLKMNGPAEEETAAEPDQESEQEAPTEDTDVSADGSDEDAGDEVSGDEEAAEEADAAGDEGKEDSEESEDKELEEISDKDSSENDKDEKKDKKSTDTADYKVFYEKVMAPFKANGKMIQLQSAEEAIQLMQMGANYTKKLQDIQPHRKVLLMLQNNDLLDEGKLSYLIDLDKKDPKAIQKLLKDSGIDPMDIDTESEPDYQEGNHTVTDEEAIFRDTLEEVTSLNGGKDTIQLIQSTWDQASKEVLWSQPEILKVMHEQRESGVYERITSEIERQRILGKIAPSTSFIEAYQTVGIALYGQPGQSPNQAGNPTGSAHRRELDRGPAKPKPKVTDGDKAKAAGNPRNSPRSSNPIVNPLALSDEEFLKMESLKTRL